MGWGLEANQGSAWLLSPEKKMPDLPGDKDEPYDRRFVKWMIKNKVGQALPGPLCVFLQAGHKSSPASAISPGTGVHLCQGMGSLSGICQKLLGQAGRNPCPLGCGVDAFSLSSCSSEL